MKKFTLLIMLPILMLAAACNTIQGAGKDVSAAGNAVSEAAKDAKN